MAEEVAGIHTPPLQLTKINQGMYVTKTHFTLQCIILLALFCFYVVYKYGVFCVFDKSPRWERIKIMKFLHVVLFLSSL